MTGGRMKGCLGCYYKAGNSSGTPFCNYMEMAGKTRLAQGATLKRNGGCKLYTDRKRHIRTAGQHTSEKRTELWRQGWTDQELAAISNTSIKTIKRWRQMNNLEENVREGNANERTHHQHPGSEGEAVAGHHDEPRHE